MRSYALALIVFCSAAHGAPNTDFQKYCVSTMDQALVARKKMNDPSTEEYRTSRILAATGILVASGYTVSQPIGTVINELERKMVMGQATRMPEHELSALGRQLRVLREAARVLPQGESARVADMIAKSIPPDLTVRGFLELIKTNKIKAFGADALGGLMTVASKSNLDESLADVYIRAVAQRAEFKAFERVTGHVPYNKVSEAFMIEKFIGGIGRHLHELPKSGKLLGRFLVGAGVVLGTGGLALTAYAAYESAKYLLSDVVIGAKLEDGDFAGELIEKPERLWSHLERNQLTTESLCRMAESRIDLASFLDRENDKIAAATGGLVQLGGLARTETPALVSTPAVQAPAVK